MPLQSYYGGYSLVRSSGAAVGAPDANAHKSLASAAASTASAAAAAAPAPPPAGAGAGAGAGLAWMGLAALNSDWMPSLANSVAGEARRPAAPMAPVPPSAIGEDAARTSILRSLIGMQGFYRGAPLRTVTSAGPKSSEVCANKTTAAPVTTATTKTMGATKMAPPATVDAASGVAMEKKKILSIPKPIGSETWAAFSGTALTAKNSVVATRHMVVRPVAPKAIDADEVVKEQQMKQPIQSGPKPLFCDLLDLDNVSSATLKNDGITKKQQMPLPVDELLYSRQPVPPEPILAGSIRSTDCRIEKKQSNEEEEDQQLRQQQPQQVQEEIFHGLMQRTESPMSLSEEGQFLSQALLDEVNADDLAFSQFSTDKQQQNSPFLSNNNFNGGGGLLRENDEKFELFDDDDNETLENLKRVINFVMSANVTDGSPTARKESGFNMEWAKTTQPDTHFFQNM